MTRTGLIKYFEGLLLDAYLCPSNVPTIGYGTTIYPNGQKVKIGDSITHQQAEGYLEYHINNKIIPQLEKIPSWNQLNCNQQNALISFAYNLGEYFYNKKGFNSITQLLNQPEQWENKTEVHRVFGLYVMADGKILEGLVKRRKAEANLFLTPINLYEKGVIMSNNYELIFSQHFDRDKGQDYGRLLLKRLDFSDPSKSNEINIWVATSSVANKQGSEDFHQKGGIIPPAYRCPNLTSWSVETSPIPMPHVKGVEGNFYKINPYLVTTDKGGERGDFGIHRDANVVGSYGCIVMTNDRFKSFEKRMKAINNQGIKEIPLTVIYS